MKISNIINFIAQVSKQGVWSIKTDNGGSNISKSILITGNKETTIAEPSEGCGLIVKGITIVGDGNQGDVFVERENNGETERILLPAFFSAQSRAGASGTVNVRLDEGEKIIVRTVDRGATNRTFVGVSYLEVVC